MKTAATLVGSVVTAIGASACCSGPLVLVLLGFSGATAAKLERLEAYQPLFVLLTMILMGTAYYRLYIAPRRCAPGELCQAPAVSTRQRATFWIVMAFIVVLGLIPVLSSYFY